MQNDMHMPEPAIANSKIMGKREKLRSYKIEAIKAAAPNLIPGFRLALTRVQLMIVTLLVICHSGAALYSAPAPPLDKQALILAPGGLGGQPSIELYSRKLIAGLTDGGIDAHKIHVEYLDLLRHPGEAYRLQLAASLMSKYADQTIDLVFCLAQPTMDFILKEGRGVAPGAVVLSWSAQIPGGVDINKRQVVLQSPRLDISGTLQLALALFPRTERVVVIQGTGDIERRYEDDLRSDLAAWRGKLQIEDTRALTVEEIEARLSALPKNSIILGFMFSRDARGRAVTSVDFLRGLAKSSNAPIFIIADTQLGIGTIGGSVIPIGTNAAELAAKGIDILRGTLKLNAGATKLEETHAPMFDWRQLERWGADPSVLPDNTIFINRPRTQWEEHKTVIGLTIAVMACLTVMTLSLLSMNRRLKESETRFRLLAENSSDMISRHDAHVKYLYASPACRALLGYEPEELLGHSALEFIHPEDIPKVDDTRSAIIERPSTSTTVFRARRKDGEYIWIETTSRTIFDKKTGGVLEIQAASRDITQRKKAEVEIQELIKYIINLQELERQRIAKDLHDSVSQTLSAAVLNLKSYIKSPEKHGEQLNLGLQFLENASVEIREIYTDLYPSILAHMGLVATIRWYARNHLEMNGIGTELALQENMRLPHDIEVNLYRIFQEVLSNIVRHSGASKVGIALTHESGAIRLAVENDGRGFDVEKSAASGKGFGLLNIRHRVNNMKGSLSIDSDPVAGTKIVITIPETAT